MPRLTRSGILLLLLVCFYSHAAGPASTYTNLFSRVLGGSGSDSVNAIASDAAGNLYVTGRTSSTNFPGGVALPSGTNDNSDIFVAKYDPAGNRLFTRLVGGRAYDYATAIAVDALGNIYVAGYTFSTNFPVVNAFQPAFNGSSDCFVFKLDPTGSTLLFSTLLGGSGVDLPNGLAISTNGQAVISGQTFSTDFPITTGLTPGPSLASYGDAFVARLGSTGTNLVFSTFLGGSTRDFASKLRLDANGNAFVLGQTDSEDFPTTPNAHQRFLGGSEPPGFVSIDVFLTKLSPAGAVIFSTLWGGAELEQPYDLAIDSAGRAWIAGGGNGDIIAVARRITPFGFPDPPQEPPPQPAIPEAFLVRIEADGASVSFEKRFGGTASDNVTAIALKDSGNLVLLGSLGWVSFLAELDLNDSRLLHVSPFETCDGEVTSELARGPGESVYVAGTRGVPLTGSQFADGSVFDGFVSRLAPPANSVNSNHPPIVTLSLVNGPNTIFGSTELITLRPEVADLEDDLPEVRIFSGSTLIAEFAAPPYTLFWSNAPLGNHNLFAVAQDSSGLCATSCPINITVVSPPVNDRFGRGTRIVGSSFTIQGSNAGATVDPDEPDLVHNGRGRSGGGSGHTVWWCWTPPSNGVYAINVSGDGFHTVTVLEAGSLVQLGEGASTPQSPGRGAFKGRSDATYHLAVDSFYGGNFTLQLGSAMPPANDDYANRLPLSGSNLTVSASNFDATYETAVLLRPEIPGSVWWTWTAPDAGVYEIAVDPPVGTELLGTSFDLRVFKEVSGPGVPGTAVVLPPSFFGVRRQMVTVLQAGEVFDVRVGADRNSNSGEFTLRVNQIQPPSNDNFAAATPLLTGPSAAGATFGATAEPDEPSHSPYDSAASASVWYRWVAPQSGNFVLQISASQFANVGIYTGSALSNLTTITRAQGYGNAIAFTADAGVQYSIAVDAYSFGVEFTVVMAPAPTVVNDDFSGRLPIVSSPAIALGSTVGATLQAGEPQHLDSETNGASIWYSWIAPSNGVFTVTASGHFSQLATAAYTGNVVSNLTRVTRHAEFANTRFITQFTGEAGVSYAIAVFSLPGSGGQVRLDIRPTTVPANDEFANRALLSGSNVTISASNLGATLEQDGPILETYAEASVWWSWTAPQSGRYVMSLSDYSGWLGLRVFTGSELSNLVEVNSPFYSSSYVLFAAEAGEEYQIVVFGQSVGQGQGPFTLEIERIFRPVNDDFENSTELTGSTALVWTSMAGATSQPGEPFSPTPLSGAIGNEELSYPSAWWHWTATGSGLTTIRLSELAQISVYTGTSLGSLQHIATSPGFPARDTVVNFQAVAGTTYRIVVRGSLSTELGLYLVGREPVSPARFGQVGRLGDGRFQFEFETGASGGIGVIEASTDLIEWTPISTNLLDCSTFILDDPAAIDFSQRFYRLRTE